MKLKKFFLNCLNRRSFQFLVSIGFCILFLPIIIWMLYSRLIYAGGNIYIDKEPVFFMLILMILPTFGLATILSIIAIYLKLLLREHKAPEYRIKNKILTQNPIYGFFAFVFYIFAIVCTAGCIYLAVSAFGLNKEMFLHESFFIYPLFIYVLILIFIVKKV